VRGRDLSCVVVTSHARRRLVVRGRDFSCEVETCMELVGDATKRLETKRLASVGLDHGLQSSSS
jgi:hypothetical protein